MQTPALSAQSPPGDLPRKQSYGNITKLALIFLVMGHNNCPMLPQQQMEGHKPSQKLQVS